MTATEILTVAKTAGIVLEAQGDRLVVDAPAGMLTPELRDALVRHKAALLAMLTPITEYVFLRGGLAVPRPALELALDLERRGFRLSLDTYQQFQIEATNLTDADRAAIRRWKLHLGAIVGYDADAKGTQ